MKRFRYVCILAAFAITFKLTAPAMALSKENSSGPIKESDLKEWLYFIASDELEGRDTYSEGLGIAAQYIAERLKSWGVKPGGANGSYFQRVAVKSVKTEDHSTVTVETNGQSKTFKTGEGFALNGLVGGKRSFTTDQLEFVGYGISASSAGLDDYANASVHGKVAVWLGNSAPAVLGQNTFRLLGGRGRTATEERGAIAGIGPGGGGGRRQGGRPGAAPAVSGQELPDMITSQSLELPRNPVLRAQDEFLEFLFSGQDMKYADLKAKAIDRGSLPHFTFKGVKITFNLDAQYRVLKTQYTRNVVGMVEGRDKKLKDTVVAFGAHYDHVGYAQSEIVTTESGSRRPQAPGRVSTGAIEDRIWNGADDDGSGTVSLLGLAKAFAKGPHPKRSMLFVWHAGEEKGLYGSQFFADNPLIPLDKISAQLNIDMIGRNRDNKLEEANQVYLVGADRISTELHNLAIDVTEGIVDGPKPMFEMNDPSDPEGIYYRSDHYSYAAKGIPVIFFTTGLHPDYHANTDSPDKILYDKMAKIVNYVYRIGVTVANLDHFPVRDNRGARTNKTTAGRLTP